MDAKNPIKNLGDGLEISVVVPTYNRSETIGRAIESILKQSFSDFEVIIIDDGSTDNTEDVIKEFKDDRIRPIKFEENKGAQRSSK